MPNEQFYEIERLRKLVDVLQARVEGTEASIVSLTSAQKITNDEIEDLAGDQQVSETVLYGDRQDRDSGLVGQVNSLETKVNSFEALMHGDRLGHGGILNEFRDIRSKVLGKEQNKEYSWKFWATLISTVGLVAAALIHEWPAIAERWNKNTSEMGVLETKIRKAKHPHKTVLVPKRVVVDDQSDNAAIDKAMP